MEIEIDGRTAEVDPADFEQLPDGSLRARNDDAAFALAWSLLDDGEEMYVHEPSCPVTANGGCACSPTVYRKGAKA